jgi:hypothetical protein
VFKSKLGVAFLPTWQLAESLFPIKVIAIHDFSKAPDTLSLAERVAPIISIVTKDMIFILLIKLFNPA